MGRTSSSFTGMVGYLIFISSLFTLVLISLSFIDEKRVELDELRGELNSCQDELTKLERVRVDSNRTLNEDVLFELVEPYVSKDVPYSIVKQTIRRVLTYEYPDPLFVAAIIIVESNFNNMAKSKAKASGCMQVRYSVWGEELKKQGIIKEYRDLYDPQLCVDSGMYVLLKYYDQTGSWEKSLYKYVGGSQSYVNRVFKVYGELKLKALEKRVTEKNQKGGSSDGKEESRVEQESN